MDAELASRIARVEARQDIGQLAARYAYAADARDIDALVELFVPGGDFGVWGHDRSQLADFFDTALRRFYRSMHQVYGHVIDLELPDRGTGKVYCRAEHEEGQGWYDMAICYFDRYVRVDGNWYFEERRLRHWYSRDVRDRPHGPSYQNWPGHENHIPELPRHFPTWQPFWAASDPAHIGSLTSFPVGDD
jgi:hypothetical protein